MIRRNRNRASLCEQVREHISAGLDGEETSELSPVEITHFMGCEGWRNFEQGASLVTRQVRIHVLEPAPDLSKQILERISAEIPVRTTTHSAPRRRSVTAPRVAGWAAAVIPLGLALSGFTSSAFAQPRVLPTHPAASCTAGLSRR
jgi:predicted anti-sigma-YlaC factor YlaD